MTRELLARWEALVARVVGLSLYHNGESAETLDFWRTDSLQHLVIVAADHVSTSLGLLGLNDVGDADTRQAIADLRDTFEHWNEHLPTFSTTPRPTRPTYPGPARIADQVPRGSPYGGRTWSNETGPVLGLRLPADDLLAFLDDATAAVLELSPDFAECVTAPRERPWLHDEYGRWPPDPKAPSSRRAESG